eukprot:scaffold63946_cov61-Phaeocystis_antarctica.AAC.5
MVARHASQPSRPNLLEIKHTREVAGRRRGPGGARRGLVKVAGARAARAPRCGGWVELCCWRWGWSSVQQNI